MDKNEIDAGVKGRMLPGIAGICLFMIFMTMVNVYAALRGVYGQSATKYAILAICTLLAVGIFGLLRLRKWGWALVTAGCLLFAVGYFYYYSKTHIGYFLIQGLFGLLFFLYLSRRETRDRLIGGLITLETRSEESEETPVPKGSRELALSRTAGVLLLLAGPSCLGLTTADPGNPSGLAFLVMILAFFASYFSFMSKRSTALICTQIFVFVSGLSALIGPLSLGSNQDALAFAVAVIVVVLVRGGVGCMLGLWALWCLRDLSTTPDTQDSRDIS